MALAKGVLDTRFFFALYNPSSPKQEEWCKSVVLESERNKKLGAGSSHVASCITITELYENMGRLVGRDVVRLRISSIKNSGIEFIPINEDISELAGDLKLNQRDLPTSDALISATALILSGGRVFTDDEHFKGLKKIKPVWTV